MRTQGWQTRVLYESRQFHIARTTRGMLTEVRPRGTSKASQEGMSAEVRTRIYSIVMYIQRAQSISVKEDMTIKIGAEVTVTAE